jgi:glyoxylase-like metal-dependent hydrolase (beta-lactamase superfamily II)
MHEIYALHVGDKRTVRSEFLFRERSQDELTVSFYFWVVLGGPEPVLYDVTFDEEHANSRKLHLYRDRTELLAQIGIDPAEVRTVVMSHLHWDHWSGHALFPKAKFIVQSAEAAFWTGRAARYEMVMASATQPSLEALLRLNFEGRIELIDGTHELWPGLMVIPVGGHTPGMQIMVVETERGNVVLANDTMHFYENYEKRRPVQVTMNFPEALDALETVKAHASAEELIVAGHDPLLCSRFPEQSPGVYRVA